MEKIIENLVENLSEQRLELVRYLKELDPHILNYTLKKMDLDTQINNIDMRIDNKLHTLDGFLSRIKPKD
jgi:hypothetical protein